MGRGKPRKAEFSSAQQILTGHLLRSRHRAVLCRDEVNKIVSSPLRSLQSGENCGGKFKGEGLWSIMEGQPAQADGHQGGWEDLSLVTSKLT